MKVLKPNIEKIKFDKGLINSYTDYESGLVHIRFDYEIKLPLECINMAVRIPNPNNIKYGILDHESK